MEWSSPSYMLETGIYQTRTSAGYNLDGWAIGDRESEFGIASLDKPPPRQREIVGAPYH